MATVSSSMFPQSGEVSAMQSVISQNADIRGGKATMFLNRTKYFRKLDEQDATQYDTMVDMAPVYTLYPKVVDGFVGTIFRKPVILTGADDFDQNNVDLLGNTLQEYCQEISRLVFEDGFCATITDWSEGAGKSFFRKIPPEQFVSFKVSNDKGYPEVTRFIYKEDVEEDTVGGSEFATEDVEYHTVIDINEDDYVRIRRYKTDNDSDAVDLVSETYPVKNGVQLSELPVILHGVEPNNFNVGKSPLQDISDLNISVDQRVIDMVYLLHWSALPTPWATGVDASDEDAPKSIGPTKIWLIGNDMAKVGMLEFSGDSYAAHLSYIDHLMYIMSAIGAQILKKEGVSRETASSVLIRTGAQTSLIATIVDNISGQIENALKMKMDWDGTNYTDDMSFTLNRDFIQVDMEPNAQIALVKSWLDGAVSYNTVFGKMKEGEIIPPTRTVEEELEMIKKNPPPFFQQNMQNDLDIKAADKAAKHAKDAAELSAAQPATDNMSGSNLETGTGVSNPMATE